MCDRPIYIGGISRAETDPLVLGGISEDEALARIRQLRTSTDETSPNFAISPFEYVENGDESYFHVNSALRPDLAKAVAQTVVNDIAIYNQTYHFYHGEKLEEEYSVEVKYEARIDYDDNHNEREVNVPVDVIFNNPRIIHKALKRAIRGIGFKGETEQKSVLLQFALYDLVHEKAREGILK